MEFYQNKKGFTLVEILVVIVMISILFGFFLYIWDNMDIFRKSRDSKRINDLNLIDSALKTLLITEVNFNLGQENTIYISLPDNNLNCNSHNLPQIFSPYSYRCQTVNDYLKIDGNGWIPINFTLGKILNLTVLPVDPLNNKDYFYSYQVKGGRYKLTAKFESPSNIFKMANDNGFEPTLYEIGSNLYIPSPQSSLVAYWSFDEATGTVAYDLSGNDNNGTLYNGPQWTTGKVGKALNFDGNNDYLLSGPSSSLNEAALHYTIVVWLKGSLQNEYWKGIIGKAGRNYNIWLGNSNSSTPFIHHRFHTNIAEDDYCPDLNGIIWDEWNFVVITNDGSECYTYIFNTNGNFYSKRKHEASLLSDNSAVQIAKNLDGANSNYFNGIVDEVRIYNRALSAEQIKAIYELTK